MSVGTDNESTILGRSSSIINDQLVATAEFGAIMPEAAAFVVPGAGAGVNTLPGDGIGGAATDSFGNSVGSDGSLAETGHQSSGGTILGLPSIVFVVLAVLLVGYIFVWQVHFK